MGNSASPGLGSRANRGVREVGLAEPSREVERPSESLELNRKSQETNRKSQQQLQVPHKPYIIITLIKTLINFFVKNTLGVDLCDDWYIVINYPHEHLLLYPQYSGQTEECP